MKAALLRQITELETMTLADLRERWRELYGTEPPGYSRTHLAKRLAYRVQELAYGGLSDVARAKLREHVEADTGRVRPLERRKNKDDMPVVGTRLIREWHGERYEVTVVQSGFEFDGRRYRSLTAVAKAITGAHWNGRKFFGLPPRSNT